MPRRKKIELEMGKEEVVKTFEKMLNTGMARNPELKRKLTLNVLYHAITKNVDFTRYSKSEEFEIEKKCKVVIAQIARGENLGVYKPQDYEQDSEMNRAVGAELCLLHSFDKKSLVQILNMDPVIADIVLMNAAAIRKDAQEQEDQDPAERNIVEALELFKKSSRGQ
ncbi:MAG: hypothetical protein KGH61_05030 [Candidatus Micrarchaeota archaeon]|nr:hypothetical protein [Candidatus Micrarchaeota archaeon]MDE1848279.1 hypothetical protein [Candidatus Micrarchaeota archaeon]MDE1864584.1 hypothetical protein [Candidatus Micrarchaeota archaeon]